jgi:hypothetical protein
LHCGFAVPRQRSYAERAKFGAVNLGTSPNLRPMESANMAERLLKELELSVPERPQIGLREKRGHRHYFREVQALLRLYEMNKHRCAAA